MVINLFEKFLSDAVPFSVSVKPVISFIQKTTALIAGEFGMWEVKSY